MRVDKLEQKGAQEKQSQLICLVTKQGDLRPCICDASVYRFKSCTTLSYYERGHSFAFD